MTGAPFLVLQISDTHIGGNWGDGGDPIAGLREVVDEVLRLPNRPDAVLLTGDLAEHGAADEYATVRELTSAIPAPLHVLPGNHDDRAALRAQFELPGSGSEAIHYAADLGPLRLLALDTSIPGRAGGALGGDQLAWLDAELAGAPAQPTLLALHHPPIATGIAPWDEIGLAPADRAGLAGVLEDHPQVRRLVAGHVHQIITGALAGRPVLTIPSTYVQARLDFTATELELAPGPRGFALHALVDGEIVSYVRTPVA
ncbi:MAG TPA: phosphodiesterase [Solirubrobacteraceae bacterium]